MTNIVVSTVRCRVYVHSKTSAHTSATLLISFRLTFNGISQSVHMLGAWVPAVMMFSTDLLVTPCTVYKRCAGELS